MNINNINPPKSILRFIKLWKQNFVSSSSVTPQFQSFHRAFKSDFSKLLQTAYGVTNIEINRGHFYSTGFFQMPSGQIYYVNISDVRFSRNYQMMIRTATSFKDYSGGSNQYINAKSKETFIEGLHRVIGQ